MSNITKFDLDETESIYDYYQEYGYVVIKNAINSKKINKFIRMYEAIRKNPLFVYYSQSIHVCTRPKLSSNNFIEESMENASRLAFFRNFSKSIQSCIYDDNVVKALTSVSSKMQGGSQFVSWQNMFFDKSIGTIEHQDIAKTE